MTSHVEKGRAIQQKTLGDDYWDRRTASTNDFNRAFRDMTDEMCFNRAWADGPLEPKYCSLLVTSLLACMGRVPELKTHLAGAVNNGCSADEIRQAMTIVGAYAGIPAGVEGIRSAEGVLKERGLI
ncbi:carboxymuconolactone decarboxylase family protein [Sphingomonas sp. MG17]|uniref:Carboxymuconolactone decarboxylase family protein n=1 Tax=Sphingomonas tagetis TaxID=2949092 RepID=A0A9X2HMU7_9SPHN|nr:carboxymuconolactone decarboxylase family protein [Sphingomonas tagetis]MCP3730609.1 carboxymuconolactone decarboxylase family protein [Sphingomonas tagetis]